MIFVKVIFGAVCVAVASWFALTLFRFNRKRLQIIRAADSATNEQLENIYRLIRAGSSDKPAGFVLGRLNGIAGDKSCVIAVPGDLENFPWTERSIAAEVGDEIRFSFLNHSFATSQLLGKRFAPVAVPRVPLKSGKLRTQFNPAKYVEGNETLRKALQQICPEYPSELLSFLLCAGGSTFEFEPTNQARIGTTAAWVQDPEVQYCPRCKRQMALILQVPGTLLHKTAFRNGTIYLFGCREHAEQTSTVTQFG